MDDLRDRFESRILPVATATVHDLTLVTRDTSDFEIALESILNPWSD